MQPRLNLIESPQPDSYADPSATPYMMRRQGRLHRIHAGPTGGMYIIIKGRKVGLSRKRR
jgi:hypothetical protein